MDAGEIQARATIAAALIAVHAVEIPTIPKAGSNTGDDANLRLRALIDSVYRAIVSDKT
jgi:hypothetical protein